ncbi:MAG: hypothetical protein IJH76_01610 [Clostridia bacterium]|nr:hypothetical protein [Clostridia bacterium]
MKNKKLLILIAIVVIAIIIFIFIIPKMSKTKKIGKNSSSQEIVDYILNINSYEAQIEVKTNSNKNSNKYMLKQQYIKDKVSTQEVQEPTNIAGVKIIKNGNSLKLENTALNLSSIIDNYDLISDNCLDLNCFIDDYLNNDDASYEEKDGQIIMKTSNSNDNKYTQNKELYIDKNTGNPTKMEVTDINKNITVYILYKEVKINSLDEKNIIAFSLYNMPKGV